MQSKARFLSLATMIWMLVLFCAATVAAAPAQNTFFTNLANFDGTNGAVAFEALIQAANGNFYGTASSGGNPGCSGLGCGTVFKISASGTLTTVYSFCSQPNCTDGSSPGSVLVQARDGNLYGTTEGGGSYSGGTVFKLTPMGGLTTLYSFEGSDGATPYGPLIQATDGNFYGTTSGGGANNAGTAFRLTPMGTLTTLYSFCSQPNCTDGTAPYGGLLQGTDGNFYGTTEGGGDDFGTVFKVTSTGTFTTLYRFKGTEGSFPYAGLIQATDGNFYGTTSLSGSGGFNGTVFKITSAGVLTIVYSFCSQPNCTDGGDPYDSLVQARDGNLYGTTSGGGTDNDGTVFKITPAGTLTTLHSFQGTDGLLPFAGLVQAIDGSFYGTTSQGGSYGYGTVFRVGEAGSCATCRP